MHTVVKLSAGENCQFCVVARAGIFKKAMGARNRGGIGLSYRPARLHRLVEFIPWNQFRGPINIEKYGLWSQIRCLWRVRNTTKHCTRRHRMKLSTLEGE